MRANLQITQQQTFSTFGWGRAYCNRVCGSVDIRPGRPRRGLLGVVGGVIAVNRGE